MKARGSWASCSISRSRSMSSAKTARGARDGCCRQRPGRARHAELPGAEGRASRRRTSTRPKLTALAHDAGIHCLTNDVLADKPAWPQLAERVHDFLGQSWTCAHHAHVDYRELHRYLPTWEPADVLDTLRLAKATYDELGSPGELDRSRRAVDSVTMRALKADAVVFAVPAVGHLTGSGLGVAGPGSPCRRVSAPSALAGTTGDAADLIHSLPFIADRGPHGRSGRETERGPAARRTPIHRYWYGP